MTFTEHQKAELAKPLDPRHVAQRTQAGRQLSYIEGWHAIAEANRIFGFDSWARETVELRQLGEPYAVNDKWRVNYAARVRITVETDGYEPIVREGCGFGQGIDKDVGQAHESALKEAETDAMKRALMTFGNPFGLALYDKTQANVQAAPPPAKRAPAPTANAVPQTLDEEFPGTTESFRMMIGQMRKSASPDALNKWKDANRELVNALDKAEVRVFRKAFDDHMEQLQSAMKKAA